MEQVYSKILYNPPPPSYKPEDVNFINGQIAYKWIPNSTIQPSTTIIYSHGTGSDLGQIERSMTEMGQLQGVNVLIWDYPGYGQSLGYPSEESLFGAIESVYSYVIQHYPSNKIILFGTSLGSGPTLYLASQLEKYNLPYSGVILKSPITSVVSTVFPNTYAPRLRKADTYLNYKHIRNVTKPTFIIHGESDWLVPYTSSQLLAQRAPNLWKLWIVPGAGHDGIRKIDPQTYDRLLGEFIHS